MAVVNVTLSLPVSVFPTRSLLFLIKFDLRAACHKEYQMEWNELKWILTFDCVMRILRDNISIDLIKNDSFNGYAFEVAFPVKMYHLFMLGFLFLLLLLFASGQCQFKPN